MSTDMLRRLTNRRFIIILSSSTTVKEWTVWNIGPKKGHVWSFSTYCSGPADCSILSGIRGTDFLALRNVVN